MKFSAAAFVALGLLAGNVLSAPTVDASDVALPIEVRAEDFVANDAAHLEARAKKKKNAKAAGAKAKGAAAKGNANANAKKAANANAGAAAAAKKNNGNANAGAAAKKNNGNANAKKNAGNANAKKNNGNAATAPPANAAQFSGLACTDGKGAGSCNAQGQCAVNGKTTAIAGQCGVAAAKKNKRWVSDIAHLI
ncbi:hypothetical protein CGCF415_v013872 [Colletotrichum fructicola]|uniref:Uncharacterized protein n=1 Tax=Colletotrichum fructicola (strain Nara gc5) TaxID=1213859 RepID=L2FD24_COLFN|nr:uncharacterized protein CGMCC3_g13689 [Colletotrichum fructicola]XP_053031348.1 uncharacterized protein COL26b_012066 [Colletotrichum chrysophilum]KAF4477417.1 hypothetical protein CGGC5_v014157 [Colletotrichum fructicola Nara gc5]KAI8278425.1 hypothetical protein K4K60_006303 [Colletotrichum sp. SAR11_57]KAE9570225.1 hypothetical protein CGMCC3_g13689 [Colletotrichum fructicola]KAF4421645.1 hypothetical protein CFRS1_v013908 [Colletotrichum fructicola]KAF4890000.1 hypothetical protein CGC